MMGTSELVVVVFGLLTWILGYWTGQVGPRKKLRVMTDKYHTANMAAKAWLAEAVDLAAKVKEEKNE